MPEVILAIDTTSEHGSIALADGARVLEEVALGSADGFAHVLFGEIEQLLARHSLTVRQIDCIAVASGPGTFTGVRVGLTAAKGLAEATGRAMIAVSNLRALASLGAGALRAPVIDARRGDVFGAIYDANLEMVREEVVTRYEDFVTTLPAGAEILTGPHRLAAAIARIASIEFEKGPARDPAEIDANYVRRSDAEVMWRDVR